MSELNVDAADSAVPGRSKDLGRRLRSIATPILIFIAGAATAIIGQRLLLSGGADELRIIAFQDWQMVCPPQSDEADCELAASVIPGQITLLLDDPTLGSRLQVLVPHGVSLDPGLGFSIGDQPLQVYQYETCVAEGCFALVTVDTTTLELLRSNMNGEVVVVPADGAPVTVPYSLNGFSDGYQALIDERARRNSMWNILAG
jgi:invasion protein IalB